MSSKKKPTDPLTPRQIVAHQKWLEDESRKVRSDINARRITDAEDRLAALSHIRRVLARDFAGATTIRVVIDIDAMPRVEFDLLTMAPPLSACRTG